MWIIPAQNETVRLRRLMGECQVAGYVPDQHEAQNAVPWTGAGNPLEGRYAKDGGVEDCHF